MIVDITHEKLKLLILIMVTSIHNTLFLIDLILTIFDSKVDIM